MATSDQPNVDLVLGSLKREVEAKRPEPLGLRISDSTRIVFTYPLIYKRSEREEFQKIVVDALQNTNEQPLMERMLSEEDLAKYDAEDLDDDVHMAVIEAVGQHFGFAKEIEDEGKGDGSGLL